MKPVFITENLTDKGTAKIVGKENEHLKLDIFDSHNHNNLCFNCIAFKQSDKYNIVRSKKSFDLCYCVEENEFHGMVNLQLKVKDLK